MLTKQKIEQFYKDVEALGLKKPVADISKATGDGKGNVSKYLKRTLEPSEQFIDRFYEAFKSSIKVVSRETEQVILNKEALKEDVIPTISDLLREKEERLNEKEGRLKDAKEYADRFLKIIESNLTDISKLQREHYAYLLAAMQRGAERFAKDDPSILDDEMNKISKYAADHLEEILQKGKPARAKG